MEFGELNKSLVIYLRKLFLDLFKADKKLVADIFYKVTHILLYAEVICVCSQSREYPKYWNYT